MKQRLDGLLVSRGLVATRTQAQARVLAGEVWVAGRQAQKPAEQVIDNAQIEIRGPELPFVSRGGVKLEHALNIFKISAAGKVAVDIGASTGGFTDCLLQRGAVRVYAVDVGYGQLAWKLRGDPHVVVLERLNARYLQPDHLNHEKVELATVDVSFISLTKILPAIMPILADKAEVVPLVKPQFEVGKGKVGKGGIVRDPEKHRQVLDNLAGFSRQLGFMVQGMVQSPILGAKGNTEFFLHLVWGET